MSTQSTFHTFTSLQAARDYRHEHGTGGWIFVPEYLQCILFPPEFTPTMIFEHPFARDRTGRLIGN